MKNILILQFRKHTEHIVDEVRIYTRAFQHLPVTLTFRSAFHDGLDLKSPDLLCVEVDAIILGGSGDLFFDGGLDAAHEAVACSCNFARTHAPLFDYITQTNMPLLGICFGHQIFAHFAGVRVHNDLSQAKMGSHTIMLTDEGRNDPLFAGLPPSFAVQYGHKDSLSEMPLHATLLASGKQCKYSALRLGPKRYSLQFHPELTGEDIRSRCAKNPAYLPKGSTVENAICESPHASHILDNFVYLIMYGDK
ncbi:type 1 glutamine amidotransferase [Candidatus Kaiserbacteria bacterium]|nr:MAG: type 1 glutamine amidotransferase [Candidatus Kaiserbacteria bacterium]